MLPHSALPMSTHQLLAVIGIYSAMANTAIWANGASGGVAEIGDVNYCDSTQATSASEINGFNLSTKAKTVALLIKLKCP